ncbi:hypothetical protein DVH24_008907 [Malus domestica]|uniref:Uncharacterized protein n=1 Tax=Malus domestica TaxID=3750 RepID=A0A498JR89_MALDO|nr:hypothetical protein DVH24_008907 [Malus domestica]
MSSSPKSKVPGRHPERWRKDAAGNVVCKRFCNSQGCLCFEYDHIVLFSKGLSFLSFQLDNLNFFLQSFNLLMNFEVGGESTEGNCHIPQTRFPATSVSFEAFSGQTTAIYTSYEELDIIEMAVYGDVIRPGNQCRCRTVAEMLGQHKSKDQTAACKLQ